MINQDGFSTNFLVAEGDGPNDLYRDLLEQLIERGKNVSPRGLPTLEVRPAMIIIENPRERFLTCPGRFIHPYFQVQEAIWILGGRGDTKFITYYLKNMNKYADNKSEFHAPYGVRMRRWNSYRDKYFSFNVRDQFFDCFKALQKDINTRQAVMVFWNPSLDHCEQETNDRPCNFGFQFLYRDHKLDLTIFNRSNDINYGLFNTNVVQFSVILETMALLLGVEVGKQIHMINSLHVYDFQGELTRKVLDKDYSFSVYDYLNPRPFSFCDSKAGDSVKGVSYLELSDELEKYFRIDACYRKGSFPAKKDFSKVFRFSLLNEGLVLSKSYMYYKEGNLLRAVESLYTLEGEDLFVSCAEFLARKIEKNDVALKKYFRKVVRDKLRTNSGLDKIEQFIFEH